MLVLFQVAALLLAGECSISIMTHSKPERAAILAHMGAGKVNTAPMRGPSAALQAAAKESGRVDMVAMLVEKSNTVSGSSG